MKISNILGERERGVSFEFFPPKTKKGQEPFMKVVNTLRLFDPMYVSVTYGAGGSTQETTRDTIFRIKEETDLNVMSHLTCIGATRKEMDSLLKDYISHGVDNILALRGDPPKGVKDFDPTKGEFKYARDLVQFVKSYGYFSVAVAVYPEGHQEAVNLEKDIEYTKVKVEAGADFAITQMFFDTSYYYNYMDKAVKAGINIPVIPGILPITDFKKVKEFASFCNTTVPQAIEKKMAPFLNSPDDMRKAGIEFAIIQCEDLLRNGVKYLHFYTLNKSESVTEVLYAISSYFDELNK
ncbi:MAG: methylenetetrahydrofolate reductase [NAD(P)H] [Nitrospirota bacterium]